MLNRGKRNYMDMKVEEEQRAFDKRNLQRLAENLQPKRHTTHELRRRNIKERGNIGRIHRRKGDWTRGGQCRCIRVLNVTAQRTCE